MNKDMILLVKGGVTHLQETKTHLIFTVDIAIWSHPLSTKESGQLLFSDYAE